MSRARLVGGNSGRASYDAVPQSLAIEPAPVPAGKQLLPSKPNEAGATIWGSLLAVLAALAAAADPMWTRHLSLHTHSDWVTMVYREVFSAIIILMYMVWEHDGFAKIDFGARNAKTAYGVGLLTCLLATSLWTFALLQTSVLHNTVCFSLAPVWTVAMQYALSMHDNLSGWDALLTATIVFCAVTILFFETDSENGIEGAGERAPTFAGDMMALGGGLCFGAYLTCCRWAELNCKDADMVLVPAISHVVIATVTGVWAMVAYESTAIFAPIDGAWAIVMTAALGCGICGAMEDGMTVRATRYISATRCACILMLEDILAPILAFAVYGEMPSRINVIQSSVLFALVLLFVLMQSRKGTEW